MRTKTAVGAAAIAVGGLAIWPHLAVRHGPTVAEVFETLRPIARISLSALAGQREVALHGQVPSGPPWPQVVASLGLPEFAIVPITPPEDGATRTYSPDDVPLQVKVKVSGADADVRPPDRFPYGYSVPKANGVIFRAAPGASFVVAASSAALRLPKGELVVIPVWGGWKVSDLLNGQSFVDPLRPALYRVAMGGAGLAFLGLVLLGWEPRRRTSG